MKSQHCDLQVLVFLRIFSAPNRARVKNSTICDPRVSYSCDSATNRSRRAMLTDQVVSSPKPYRFAFLSYGCSSSSSQVCLRTCQRRVWLTMSAADRYISFFALLTSSRVIVVEPNAPERLTVLLRNQVW